MKITHATESCEYDDVNDRLTLGRITLNTGNNALWLIAEFFCQMARTLQPLKYAIGLCTCCDAPRQALQVGGDLEEWGHVDNGCYAEMRHIHVSGNSSDCDGSYSHYVTYRLNTGIAPWALCPLIAVEPDRTPDFHNLVNYVFTNTASIWSGVTTMSIDTEGGIMRYSTRTDEGGASGEAIVCNDHWCAYDDSEQRDYSAERMGY